MPTDELAACRRMRACLAGIMDLDPAGVTARLADMDREIARLEHLFGQTAKDLAAKDLAAAGRIEVIAIGVPTVRAA